MIRDSHAIHRRAAGLLLFDIDQQLEDTANLVDDSSFYTRENAFLWATGARIVGRAF